MMFFYLLFLTFFLENSALKALRCSEVEVDENGQDLNTTVSPTNTTTNGQLKAYTEDEIRNAISPISNMIITRKERAVLWLHEAFTMYAGDRWLYGNEIYICKFMKEKFDAEYGPYWTCAAGVSIFMYMNYEGSEGFLQFVFTEITVELYKPADVYNETQLQKAIAEGTTLSPDGQKNAIKWMNEALTLWAGEKWLQRNQEKICHYMKSMFEETYGKYWYCSMGKGMYTTEAFDIIGFGLSNDEGIIISRPISYINEVKDKIIAGLIFLLVLISVVLIALLIYQLVKIKHFQNSIARLYETQTNMSQLNLIPADKLKISDKQLGDGAFGSVFEGQYLIEGQKFNVAIKVIKGIEEQDLIKEGCMMAKLSHQHLTKLIGICLADGIKMVTPLRALGSLKDYLHKHQYKLKSDQLILYSYQIASGMEYLSSHRIIHRDLATRNILMKTPKHVEITDFGLASFIQLETEVSTKMPFRWLAMECLNSPKKNLYSEHTDVWSFGVTCWEILTYAKVPYENVVFSKGANIVQALYEHLKNGNRLTRPDGCSLELYETLLLCWTPNPLTRPDFKTLKGIFERYNGAPSRYINDKQTFGEIRKPSQSVVHDLMRENREIFRRENSYVSDDKVHLMHNNFHSVTNTPAKNMGLKRSYSYLDLIPDNKNDYLEVVEVKDAVHGDQLKVGENLKKCNSYLAILPNHYDEESYLQVLS